MGATGRLFQRLSFFLVFAIASYFGTDSKPHWAITVYDFLESIVYLFLGVLGLVSLVVYGVSASGRLKAAPTIPEEGYAGTKFDISFSTFLVLLLYAVFYGVFYFFGDEMGLMRTSDISNFSHGLMFVGPMWVVICLDLYVKESREGAA